MVINSPYLTNIENYIVIFCGILSKLSKCEDTTCWLLNNPGKYGKKTYFYLMSTSFFSKIIIS